MLDLYVTFICTFIHKVSGDKHIVKVEALNRAEAIEVALWETDTSSYALEGCTRKV